MRWSCVGREKPVVVCRTDENRLGRGKRWVCVGRTRTIRGRRRRTRRAPTPAARLSIPANDQQGRPTRLLPTVRHRTLPNNRCSSELEALSPALRATARPARRSSGSRCRRYALDRPARSGADGGLVCTTMSGAVAGRAVSPTRARPTLVLPMVGGCTPPLPREEPGCTARPPALPTGALWQLPSRQTLWGAATVALLVAPPLGKDAVVIPN